MAIQMKREGDAECVRIYDGRNCLTIHDRDAGNLPEWTQEKIQQLSNLKTDCELGHVHVPGDAGQPIFDALILAHPEWVTEHTPIIFRTKGDMIEELAERGAAWLTHREELEALGLVELSRAEDGSVLREWVLDNIKMLNVGQLADLLDDKIPRTSESEVITDLHFLPEKVDFDRGGDLRRRVAELITADVPEPINGPKSGRGWVECAWTHTDADGVLTESLFRRQLSDAIAKFAQQINDHGAAFVPRRLSHSPPPSYGVAYYDWVGDSQPFDVRVVIRFGSIGGDEHNRGVAGFRFFLTTPVTLDETAFFE